VKLEKQTHKRVFNRDEKNVYILWVVGPQLPAKCCHFPPSGDIQITQAGINQQHGGVFNENKGKVVTLRSHQ
jgi:hypothetical protein